MREGDRPPFCTRPIISSLMRNSTSPLLSLSPDIFVVCLVSQSSSMVFFSSGFLPGSFTFFHARHHRLLLLLVSTSCFSLAIRAGQQESGKPRKFLFFCLLVQNARAFFFSSSFFPPCTNNNIPTPKFRHFHNDFPDFDSCWTAHNRCGSGRRGKLIHRPTKVDGYPMLSRVISSCIRVMPPSLVCFWRPQQPQESPNTAGA